MVSVEKAVVHDLRRAGRLRVFVHRMLNPGGNEYNNTSSGSHYGSALADWDLDQAETVSTILREIPGNDICTECGAPELIGLH
ncbi:hypothetical protein AgCh_010713 [Apium graveolens]